MRKTRCDAAQPRCGFCALHNVDCVYRDAQQPRIDYNTQVLLERIQLLEDRMTGLPPSQQSGIPTAQPAGAKHDESVAELDVQIALSHTANANHVYSWPLVQQLISEVTPHDIRPKGDAIDVFFEAAGALPHNLAPMSWSLSDDVDQVKLPLEWTELVEAYFTEVNVFFPLLSKSRLLGILQTATTEGIDGPSEGLHDPAGHALLLLVLCLATFVRGGGNIIRLGSKAPEGWHSQLEDRLWAKAKLLLGFVSAEITLESAQCAMLAR